MAAQDFDSDIEELSEDFAQVASAMGAVILAYLRGQVGLGDALRAVEEAGRVLATVADRWVSEVLPRIYADGAREALGSPETKDVGPDQLSADVHEESLELFMDELSEELAAATDRISGDAKANIREIGRRRLGASIDNGTNARDEARRMEDDFTERGVKFIDKSGRKWDPRSYAETILRTHTVEVSNEANLNTSAELGSPGVRVFDGGPGDVDEPCQIANGQHWSLSYARRNRLEHPNCFPAGTVVSGPPAFASTTRWFEGEVVDIWTSGGRFLAVTPNHPILTRKGWVGAGALVEGEHVISQLWGERSEPLVVPDDYQVPALIEDVAGAVGKTFGSPPRVMPTAPEDFHGDGIGSDVHVVRTDGLLHHGVDVPVGTLNEPVMQEDFVSRDAELLALAGDGSPLQPLHRVAVAASGDVGGSSVGTALLRRHTGHADNHLFGGIANGHISLDELLAQGGAGHSEFVRERLHRFAGEIASDQIIEVRRRDFVGHVFNLETVDGWYCANGIVAHNCRRAFAPLPSTFDGKLDKE